MWNGECSSVSGFAPNFWAFFNPRLCESEPNVKSAERIFGDRYAWTCTQAVYDSRAGKMGNDWECVGVDRAQVEIVKAQPLSPTGFHPECSKYADGFDTGYQPVLLRNKLNNRTFYVFNTHLAGIPKYPCRVTQIGGLKSHLSNWGNPDFIAAGDFNTEPFDKIDPTAKTFRKILDFASSRNTAAFRLISDGKTPTAFYGGGIQQQALDHVLGKNFTGSCSVAGAFDGMDHRMTTCVLKHVSR